MEPDKEKVKNISSVLEETGITFSKDHPDHIDDEDVTPPFMEYEINRTEILADGISYDHYLTVTVRYYSDTKELYKDPPNGSASHTDLEAALHRLADRWNTEPTEYLPEIDMYMTEYTLEV